MEVKQDIHEGEEEMRNRQMRQERRKKTGKGKGNTGQEKFRLAGDPQKQKDGALDNFPHCRGRCWHSYALHPAPSQVPGPL